MMEPTTVAMVFWLVLSGGIMVPVPYDDEAQCIAAAQAEEETMKDGLNFVCIQQPASDILLYGNQFFDTGHGARRYEE